MNKESTYALSLEGKKKVLGYGIHFQFFNDII